MRDSLTRASTTVSSPSETGTHIHTCFHSSFENDSIKNWIPEVAILTVDESFTEMLKYHVAVSVCKAPSCHDSMKIKPTCAPFRSPSLPHSLSLCLSHTHAYCGSMPSRAGQFWGDKGWRLFGTIGGCKPSNPQTAMRLCLRKKPVAAYH